MNRQEKYNLSEAYMKKLKAAFPSLAWDDAKCLSIVTDLIENVEKATESKQQNKSKFRDINDCLAEIINGYFKTFTVKGEFRVTDIQQIAKKVSPQWQKNRDAIVTLIQDWFDSLPAYNKSLPPSCKKFVLNDKVYALTTANGMRNFYGHFFINPYKSGSLLTIHYTGRVSVEQSNV